MMMAAINAKWTQSEQQRLIMTGRIEVTLKGTRQNMAFVGNIPEGVTDEIMDRLLSACGPVKQWRRVLDAGNLPKSFGFCEFDSADALNRALNLLHDLPMVASGGKRLLVRVDETTRHYLDEYEEALGQDEVSNSSREADTRALEEIRSVVKEKSFFPALDAIDKKLAMLNAEEPEEGEAIDDEVDVESNNVNKDATMERLEREEAVTSAVELEDRRQKRRSDRSRSREVPSPADEYLRQQRKETEQRYRQYREREARWENRQAQMVSRRRKDEALEADRLEREAEEREYAKKYLALFNDFVWLISSLDKFLGIERELENESTLLANVTNGATITPKTNERLLDFYGNRELWKTRRNRDLEKEEEADRKDEQLEERERKAKLAREHEKNEKVEEAPTINLATTSSLSSKRNRPKAAEFIEEGSILSASGDEKRRKPLLAKDYTKEELLAAGMSEEEAKAKLCDLYREKASKLVAIIPKARDELFAWIIEWKYLDVTKLSSLIKKKVAETLERYRHSERHVERLGQSLLSQIQHRADPTSIATFVYEEGRLVDDRASSEKRREEAFTFVAILWRYLVFETEAAAYGLVPPQ